MSFGIAETILASAVANAGTFTTGYPSGLTQASFQNGLAGTAHKLVVNNNDVYASGFSVAFGASTITVTNDSLGTLPAGTEIRMQYDRSYGSDAPMFDPDQDARSVDTVMLQFPVNLASITAAGDVVTDFCPGVRGTIDLVQFTMTVPVTTAARAATLNLEIGSTDVTGSSIALTSATATPLGKNYTAVPTAANVLTETDKISVEAASVTAFAEGQGVLSIRIRRT